MLITNLFKALFERWRLDSDFWAFCIALSRRRRGRKEEKKKKKKKEKREEQWGCRFWGSIWDMICRFYYFFFSWIYVWATGLSPGELYLEWDLLDFFFFSWICVWAVACGVLFGVGFYRFYLFIIIIFFLICVWLSPMCGLLLSQFFFFFNYSCLIKLGAYEIEAF